MLVVLGEGDKEREDGEMRGGNCEERDAMVGGWGWGGTVGKTTRCWG